MGLIILFAIFLGIVIATLPVMAAAHLVQAGRRGFWASFLAVLLQIVLAVLTGTLVASSGIAFLVAVVLGAAIYAWILRTSWLKGLLIGVLAAVITVLVIFVFGLLSGSSMLFF